MTNLFAALDGLGEMRFVGEVPRGAACGCRCPECDSPVLAKQGDEREWHFAHESGQERPECAAGAANMLRRLAVEYLRKQPRLELPRYERRVTVSSERGPLYEEVSWSAQFVGALDWHLSPSKSEPVASGRLDNGIDAHLLIEIAGAPSRYLPAAVNAKAEVAFRCTVPVMSDLRKRIYAEQHLKRWGQLLWKHQPDVFGLIGAARVRLRARAAADDADMARLRKSRSDAAALERLVAAELRTATSNVSVSGAASRSSVTVDRDYDWAPRRKRGTSFVFYRLKGGDAWVRYTLQDDSSALASWPLATDGWDEALPASVGIPDATLGVYRVRDLVGALTFLGRNSTTVRASSDPKEFEGL